MEIIAILADSGSLYAIQYKNEEQNEFDRLMDLWTNVTYLRPFAKDAAIQDRESFVNEISEDAEDIQDFMNAVDEREETIDSFFKLLNSV